jgi:hypothetical protein
MYGHFERGRFLRNFMWRFNWFGHMWRDYPAVERWRAAAMWVLRVVFAATALYLLRV